MSSLCSRFQPKYHLPSVVTSPLSSLVCDNVSVFLCFSWPLKALGSTGLCPEGCPPVWAFLMIFWFDWARRLGGRKAKDECPAWHIRRGCARHPETSLVMLTFIPWKGGVCQLSPLRLLVLPFPTPHSAPSEQSLSLVHSEEGGARICCLEVEISADTNTVLL